MTSKVPTCHEADTIQALQRRLHAGIHELSSINYVYVLNDDRRLVGILSLKDLYLHPADTVVGTVCKRSPMVTVPPDAHPERAVYLALQHNIKAIPVTDPHRTFLGVMPCDAILTTLEHELRDDAFRRAGVRHTHPFTMRADRLPLGLSLRHRLPWLLLGLLGGLLIAGVVESFEATLSRHLALAAFIPLVVYMSSAVGTQMEAYVIRDLAIDGRLVPWGYALRQLRVVLCIALVCSLLLGAGLSVAYDSLRFGLTLGLSLCFAIVSSVVTGLGFPFLFHRLGLDPADASGPIATIAQDFLSVFIYFSVATLLLG
jgi:magnesium transporter